MRSSGAVTITHDHGRSRLGVLRVPPRSLPADGSRACCRWSRGPSRPQLQRRIRSALVQGVGHQAPTRGAAPPDSGSGQTKYTRSRFPARHRDRRSRTRDHRGGAHRTSAMGVTVAPPIHGRTRGSGRRGTHRRRAEPIGRTRAGERVVTAPGRATWNRLNLESPQHDHLLRVRRLRVNKFRSSAPGLEVAVEHGVDREEIVRGWRECVRYLVLELRFHERAVRP